MNQAATDAVLDEVFAERERQHRKFGEQNPPDGTGSENDIDNAKYRRYKCDSSFAAGKGSWRLILDEEVAEAFAEKPDTRTLREELIQVAAVAVAWVEALDRRKKAAVLGPLQRAVSRAA